MQYLEVATLRETILHQVRTGEAVDVIEQTLEKFSAAVWHNGRAHAHNNEGAVDASEGVLARKPEPNLASSGAKMPFMIEKDAAGSLSRAELIQLTAGALTGALSGTGRHIRPEQIAEYAVGCAEAALGLINKK